MVEDAGREGAIEGVEQALEVQDIGQGQPVAAQPATAFEGVPGQVVRRGPIQAMRQGPQQYGPVRDLGQDTVCRRVGPRGEGHDVGRVTLARDDIPEQVRELRGKARL